MPEGMCSRFFIFGRRRSDRMKHAVLKRADYIDAGSVKTRVVNYWNGRADSFKIQREEELHSEQHQIWAGELLSHLNGRKGLRILDVGCGCGFFSMILAEKEHHVTGIDLTENMIRRGRELSGKYGIEVELLQMDAEQPEFEAETFDVVVSRNLTWTLPHPDLAYEQWLRVLKPGGILLNYDAEHARYHFQSGLEGEKAHQMLSNGQMDECMKIYGMLPISRWKRPDWDVFCLRQLGCGDVTADRQIGKKLFLHDDQFRTPYPVFRIKAVKEAQEQKNK